MPEEGQKVHVTSILDYDNRISEIVQVGTTPLRFSTGSQTEESRLESSFHHPVIRQFYVVLATVTLPSSVEESIIPALLA